MWNRPPFICSCLSFQYHVKYLCVFGTLPVNAKCDKEVKHYLVRWSTKFGGNGYDETREPNVKNSVFVNKGGAFGIYEYWRTHAEYPQLYDHPSMHY